MTKRQRIAELEGRLANEQAKRETVEHLRDQWRGRAESAEAQLAAVRKALGIPDSWARYQPVTGQGGTSTSVGGYILDPADVKYWNL